MLVATPGQTTAFSSTLHNSGNSAVTGPSAKKSTLSSTNTNATAASGTPKALINNNHNTTTSTNNTTSNTTTTNNSYNNHNHQQQHQNKNDNNTTTTSSKDIKSSTAHSLKTENSTKSTNFIQTLKDSVQKTLISTTGNNSIVKQNSAKLQSCNNSKPTTSLQNVTSSSSNNPKAAAAVIASSSVVATTSSSSSLSLVRSKYSACSLSKLHTIAPTIIHRFPEDRQNASSTDSLQKEMCHFKPIRTVPTTPWKSGSKSRGNSLRFPKPNLATEKTEFILKSNCDVNNRKRKQQQLQQDNLDDENDDNDDSEDEQENKEYRGIYKPKPSSTYLSTPVTTPNHQSAFVCLAVSPMKNLVNIQSTKKIITHGKNTILTGASVMEVGNLELTKPKSTRTAAAARQDALNETISSSTNSNDLNKKTKSTKKVPVKALSGRQKQKTTIKSLLQVKKLDIPNDLVKTTTSTRSTRLSLAAQKKKTQERSDITATPDKRKSPKSSGISKLSPARGVTKAKSRRKLGSAKSKTIDSVQAVNEKVLPTRNVRGSNPVAGDTKANTQINKRKRKINYEEYNEPMQQDVSATLPTIFSKSPKKSRKSVRISKDIGANNNNNNNDKPFENQLANTTSSSTSSSNSKHLQRQKLAANFSPPLTRARLKHLNLEQQQEQGKIVAIKKRKI